MARLWDSNTLTLLTVLPLFFLCVDKDEIRQLPALLPCHGFPAITDWSPLKHKSTLCFLLHIAFSGIYFITATKNWYTTNLFLNLLSGQILGLSVDANNWEIHLSLPRNESQKKSNQPTNSFSRWLHKRGIKSGVKTGEGTPKDSELLLGEVKVTNDNLSKKELLF